ncbi:MAG: PAS domain S-box protein [Methanospirillum sp.]|nr:PAS domain S-box protein [Methanospirillum sp.]
MTVQGVLTEVSPSISRIFGYSPDEVIGKDITNFFDRDSLKRVHTEISNKINHPSESSCYEIPILAQDGKAILCEIHSRYIRKSGHPPEIIGSIRDISENYRMEDAIRTSEQKYRDIVENAIEGIFQTRMNGEILSVNTSFARFFGYDSSDDLLRSITNTSQIYRHPEDRIHILQMLEQQQMVKGILVQVIRNDGEHRWISINARKVSHQGGDYIEGSGIDVTDKVHLRREIDEKERIYSLLTEHITDVIWTADREMQLNFISPSVVRLLGYTHEEVITRQLHEAYTPESLHTLLRYRRDHMNGSDVGNPDDDMPRYMELAMYHRDGHLVWTETALSLLRDNDRIPIGVVGSSRDITARKQAERAHLEMEARLKEAQQIGQIGNWEVDLTTGIFTCSEEVFRILEVVPQDLPWTCWKFLTFIHPDEQEEFKIRFFKLITESESEESVLRVLLPDGGTKHLHIRGRISQIETGYDNRIIGTIQDVTNRMRMERERAQLLRQIQCNIAELAILNDGIRNPLAVIEVMLETHREDAHHEILSQIARIDAMVSQLDKRWIDSETIFTYLQKHYGITLSSARDLSDNLWTPPNIRNS